MAEFVGLRKLEIVGTSPGPRMLITGGVHGDEYEPMAACRRLAAGIRSEILHGTLITIPCVNEAAFERGMRTADDGLDLARTCPGDAHGSITQRIAHALSEQIRAADFYIDLHTGGVQYRILPLAGYVLHRDAGVLDVQRRMARAFNLPVVWGTSPTLNGRSLSVARDANVPAIYAEFGGGSECSEAGAAAYVEGCLNVLDELGMLASTDSQRTRPANQIRHVVEDARAGSGHLQVRQPAPITGIFEARVALGDPVAKDQCLGLIIDPAGGDTVEVQAECAGLVIMLPALPRVRRGEAVAVVLEINEPPR